MKKERASIWFAQQLCLTLPLVFISLLLFSCSSNKESTIASNYIDVEKAVGNGAILNLSDYASDIQYIPLETNEESVLGTIKDIAFGSNKFFIRDNNNVVKIFDNSGKFLSTIDRNGRGPEEYNRISWSRPAPQDRGVYILDSSGDLFLYEYDGTFVEKSEFTKEEYLRFSSFAIMDSSMVIATFSMDMSDLSAGKLDYSVLILNNSLDVINKMSFSQAKGVKTTIDGANLVSITISLKEIYLHKYENQVRFLFDSPDTILTVNKEGLFREAYVINYGKYNHKAEEPSFPLSEVSKVIIISPPFFETDNYLYLQFNFGENAPEKVVTQRQGINGEMIPQTDANVNALFDKKSGELILLNRPLPNKKGFVEDIKGGLPFWPSYMGATGELITYINAFDIIDAAETDNQSSFLINDLSITLKEDDNPVVVIVKPKK